MFADLCPDSDTSTCISMLLSPSTSHWYIPPLAFLPALSFLEVPTTTFLALNFSQLRSSYRFHSHNTTVLKAFCIFLDTTCAHCNASYRMCLSNHNISSSSDPSPIEHIKLCPIFSACAWSIRRFPPASHLYKAENKTKMYTIHEI